MRLDYWHKSVEAVHFWVDVQCVVVALGLRCAWVAYVVFGSAFESGGVVEIDFCVVEIASVAFGAIWHGTGIDFWIS